MVRAGPHVDRDQRPEVHDRQAVGVDRALGLLGDEVVHHRQVAHGQQECHRVVPVPPLRHRIHGAGVERVGLEQPGRHGQVVDDVQHAHADDVGAVEPVGDIDVLDPALGDGAEEQPAVRHPDDRDQDVDRPFQLGVFLALGDAQRQGDHRADHGQLPAPEDEAGEPVRQQAYMAGALDHVQAGRKQHRAAEGEDHPVGVQRTQPAVAEPRRVEVERRPVQLGGDEHADRHAHDAPEHCRHHELVNHLVVVVAARSGSLGHAGSARPCHGIVMHSHEWTFICVSTYFPECKLSGT